MTELRWCDGCATEVAFERFDCPEHDLDCLELVCTGCGAGVERATRLSRSAAAPDLGEPHGAAA